MTSMFQHFPKITRNNTEMVNITRRIDFFDNIKQNLTLFEYYDIREGEKPEDVAYKYYGDPEQYWILFYLNDIIDPFYGWPLTSNRLLEYVQRLYGAENVYSIHHYETTSSHPLGEGIHVDENEEFSKSVSNYDYHFDLNEDKRRIKLLKRQYLDQVLTEYKNQF